MNNNSSNSTSAAVAASFTTIKQMLTDRGLDVSSFESISSDDIVSQSQSNQTFSFELPSCNIRVVYSLNQKYNNRDVKKLMNETSAAKNVTHAILVTRELPTSGSQILTQERPQIKTYEIFRLTSLCCNKSRHVLQPKFEVMSEQEVKELLEFLGTTRARLPVIYNTDPMAEYYGLAPNQVVRIIRKTPSGGSSVYYRCCHAKVAHTSIAAAPTTPQRQSQG